MTRNDAIHIAENIIRGTWVQRLAKAQAWGKLADYVLRKTGDTELSDAIWNG